MLRLTSAAAVLLLPASLLAQAAEPVQANPFESIQWQEGPATASIGSESRLRCRKGAGSPTPRARGSS
jgi:hypothetical protein